MKTKITLLVLTALLGLTNVFANSMPSSENMVENETMTTNDGNNIIITAGDGIYSLNLSNNHATLLATSPYVREINSVASDNTTGWIFYVSNHISRYNWTIYGYNVYTNIHKNFGSVRRFFTRTGHAYSTRGLASGGATFYNGKLYFAMEYPTTCYSYRGNGSGNENPKDELPNNNTASGFTTFTMSIDGLTGNNSAQVGRAATRNYSTEADETTDNGGRSGSGETLSDFEIIEGEEANTPSELLSDYIPEEDLPADATADNGLQQRGYQAESYNYYRSRYNNRMYLLEISFNGLSDTSGQTTSVACGRPVYDNCRYSSFLYRGELGDIVVDNNGQLYAATSYQVQAYNFNRKKYDWANNEDVYAQMAKDKNSKLKLLKNKRQCSTNYNYGCPSTSCTTKSFVQEYTPPSCLRTYNNIQLGALHEITGLAPNHVGRITDASDYISLTPPVSYKIQGFVYDDNNENGNYNGGQGETKTSGITVTLYADNNNDSTLDSGDTVIDTKVTNASGSYTFNDVQVAQTLVKVTKPNNTARITYTATTPETVAVTGSTVDVNVTFGINELQIPVNYSISGNVYDDDNANGTKDVTEGWLNAMTLKLYDDANSNGVADAGETVIATATTGVDGTYNFANVTVENTVVAVTVPANTAEFTYASTTAGVINTSSITTNRTNVNFGINKVQIINYNISGNVYDDDNANGTKDVTEGWLNAMTLKLYDDANSNGVADAGETVIATATTGADGTYNFANVTVENTVVAVTVPANTAEFTYALTTAGSLAASSTITDITGLAFGINKVQIINYNISGNVYDDDNANGTKDVAEGWLNAMTLKLYDDANSNGVADAGETVIATATTGVDGTYNFANVTVENTVVAVTVPANTAEFTYASTTAGVINTSSITTNRTNVNFGINKVQVINYNISGTVFDDDNANGLIDARENTLRGVTVILYADTDNNGRLGAVDTVVSTTTSANDGTYNFANVTEANTLVVVTVPTNDGSFTYVLTTAGEIVTDSTITDVTGVNFGINKVQVINYNISGVVFDDDNLNGSIDARENTLRGVTVTLYVDADNNGRLGAVDTVISTTTSANDGTYNFANVTEANTLVAVTLPTNDGSFTYVLTTAGEIVTDSIATDITGANFGINRETTTYSITGTVFDDNNENGRNDSELGLSDISVRLYNDLNQNGRVDRGEPLLVQTLSDRNGNYQFTGLTNVFVVIQALVPSATTTFRYTPTTAVSLGLSSGTSRVVDFGINRELIVLYNISGVVWDDDNANQTKDNTEVVLSDVSVSLYDDANANGVIDSGESTIATVLTTSTGAYSFTGVNVQNVVVKPQTPSNGTHTTARSLALTSVNNDITNANFGINVISNLYQVTGVVFDDDNRNGIADAGEGSIDGLAVQIYVDTDGSGTFDENLDALVAFTQTSNGSFDFANPNYVVNDVPTGQVFIRIVIPAGNPPLLTYTPTYDPDSGTTNPDGVYQTIMTGNVAGVNFGIDVVDFSGTARPQSTTTAMIGERIQGSTISPVDVSSKLRLYPNPTVNQIAINAEEFSGDVAVEVYNDRGYKVLTTTTSPFGGELKVDVQRLKPGMYYVKFGSRNKVASKKFVKR